MKLGLFGGTFNPVHYGHMQVAVELQRQLWFDHIYFIPSKHPPHKNEKELASASNRCEMILRSIQNNSSFGLSYVELNRNGPSYSIDTVKYFKSRSSFKDELYFILGIDAFLEFHTWKSYKKLIKLAELVVVSRFGTCKNLSSNMSDYSIIQKYISEKLFSDLGDDFRVSNISKPIHYFRIKSPNISSSLIRNLIKLNKKISYFVPKGVAKYIIKKGLYL